MNMLPDVESLEPITEAEGGFHPLFADVPSSVEFNKLRKRLLRLTRQAIEDFAMVRPGDRWLVALSGGKDSYGLLAVLLDLKWRGLLPVELLACNLDQGHPGFPSARLEADLRGTGAAVLMLREDTYSVVKRLVPEGKTACSVCSRLRRGILYRAAREHGCTKIALGHHRDDLIESLLMSMIFSGKLRSMPPRLRSDDGQNVVIRPLCYAAEADIAAFAAEMRFPIIPCDLCGSQENLQRKHIKAMLGEWEKRHPGRIENILRSLQNSSPSHLLDRSLFDFSTLDPVTSPATAAE